MIKTLREGKSLKALYQLHRNVKWGPSCSPRAQVHRQRRSDRRGRGRVGQGEGFAGRQGYTVQIGPEGKPKRYKSR
ncbi:MAG: hypothetical protein Ct9H300mP1_39530 [Planctomycetaceae bacterium]|nr:MAG: hypothetical protein Ct9H300mP1_39530 [Planctomycetaceae bacterium]